MIGTALRFFELDLPENDLGGISIHALAALKTAGHPAMEKVEAFCRIQVLRNGQREECGESLGLQTKFFSPITCCDSCRLQAEENEHIRRCKHAWEAVCPEGYRDTDPHHPGFPKAIHDRLAMEWDFDKSLALVGPSRTGKTRTGFMLLKRALFKSKSVSVLNPWDLDEVKRSSQKAMIGIYGGADVLLMDDVLQAGAHDERITGFLKNLIEFRISHKKPFILTSQIGGTDYTEAADKFGMKKSDLERIEAMLNRITEVCEVIRMKADETPAMAATAATATKQVEF